MKLALGTVQFGLDYGVTNKTGRVSESEVRRILQAARLSGVDTLDTAVGYGDSESVLGRAGVDGFRVVTKVGLMPDTVGTEDATCRWLVEQVEHSCARLQIPCIDTLLLHRPEQLLSAQGDWIAKALAQVRAAGVAKKVGFSVYGPDTLADLVRVVRPDVVQAPLNLIDRRLISSGWLERLHAMGTEVHVRSVFLQGLLLARASERPASFSQWQSLWARWDAWLASGTRSALQACLQFATTQPGIDRVVVGVESADQFAQLVAASRATAEQPDWPDTVSNEENLINPARWKVA